MKGLGIIIVVLLAIFGVLFLMGEEAEDRCETAGGRIEISEHGGEICVGDDGRLITEW